MTGRHWEHFHHEADIGVRGCGQTLAEAFEEAAIGLTAIITDPGAVCATEEVMISCEAPDRELLFADWLNALIFEMATRVMLFRKFHVQLHEHRLSASVWGEGVNQERHKPAVEVKGATYTELVVRSQPGGGWCAQCVVDV